MRRLPTAHGALQPHVHCTNRVSMSEWSLRTPSTKASDLFFLPGRWNNRFLQICVPVGQNHATSRNEASVPVLNVYLSPSFDRRKKLPKTPEILVLPPLHPLQTVTIFHSPSWPTPIFPASLFIYMSVCGAVNSRTWRNSECTTALGETALYGPRTRVCLA